jgi:superfamily II DNA or RNA helicase
VAANAWKAWARAEVVFAPTTRDPQQPPMRSLDERVAFARLVLFSGVSAERFRMLSLTTLGPAAEMHVLERALCAPFMPDLFARMDASLRAMLLLGFDQIQALDDPAWQSAMAWLDAQVHSAPKSVAAPLRFVVAERRLQRGDVAGCKTALIGVTGLGVPLMQAAMLAHAGRWAEASAAFASGLKEAARVTRLKRGLASHSVLEWYALSLLAQPEPTAWAQALKVCTAESGLRRPMADAGWGLWAHAAAARLGDATLLPHVFDAPLAARPRQGDRGAALAWAADNARALADRLLLSAWLDHSATGWTPNVVNAVVRTLHARGRPWKADLVRQACHRMGMPVPARAEGDPPAWDAGFFGQPAEAWRDALAAIEALGGSPGAGAAATAAPTLQWRLTLDKEGRPQDLAPYEVPQGARGPGKPRPLSFAKLKKSTRLDPRDAAVARCIGPMRWQPGQLAIDVAGAAIALAGHPGLVFDDAPGQPVDLHEALPQLEVRRQSAADGSESFVFDLLDPLLAKAPPDPGLRFTGTDPSSEAARRDSLRVVRDAPDRARLLRISAAQRRVAELVAKQWAVPVQAQAELEAALRVLAGHFQLHSDAVAGQALPSEARLRAQLSPLGGLGGGLQLQLLVQPFGSFGPVLPPGQGRPRLMALHQGLSVRTERDLALETQHLQAVLDALPELAGLGSADTATWDLADPETALAVVERLPLLPAVAALDWPRGKPLRVVTPQQDLQVTVGSGADWFSVDGSLRVDESRVLSLQRLMQLALDSKRSRFVALGDGDYLALTDRLRQQLADLQALAHSDKGTLKLSAAAVAFLADTLEGSPSSGDQPWQQRLARLDEAAALQPEPPPALQAQLRSYQAEGYAWMVRLAHAGLGACLADDMGLGKTVQTLALLLQRSAEGPALVIAPTSVCGNWAAEAERFAPSLRVQVYGGTGRAATLQQLGPGDVLVASYALVQIDAAAFAAVPWASLVLDEAQALKNAATKRVKAIATLQAGFRLALTGTPVENRLADLWSIMQVLNPGLLGSSGQFQDRFAGPIERQHDDAVRQRLRRLVSPFLLRRTKAQVLTDLPPRTEIIHRVEPGPEERSFLEALRRSALERVADLAKATEGSDGKGAGQAGFQVLAELTRLRRAACDPRLVAPELGVVGAKVQEFEQLAVELVAGRHKALVFSQFTDFLRLLADRLDACGIAYQTLDGSTPPATRDTRVAAFQRGEGDLFLISLKAGGFGLNLTAADYVLIVDPWWNPAAEDQAMGRAHRIGQQRPVTVYRLVTAGSIEERIVALHRDKRSLADGILEGQDKTAPLRADDLRSLLQAD